MNKEDVEKKVQELKHIVYKLQEGDCLTQDEEELLAALSKNEKNKKAVDTLLDEFDWALVCTCSACPEQYDVFDKQEQRQVGYLRLRHGYFRADYPDCGGNTVYSADTIGDGAFAGRAEYTEHVSAALIALRKEDVANGH